MNQGSWSARDFKPLVKPVLWLLVVLLLTNFSLQVPTYAAQQRVEFVAYLVSSKVIATGRGAAHFYDNDLFQEEIDALGYEATEIFYPHPPTTALVFLPLSKFDFQTARWIWIYLTLFFMVVAIALQFKELKLSSPLNLIALSIVLICQPYRADLWHGQAYTLMLLLTTLTWLAYRRNHQVMTGLTYAGMIAAKLFALPLYMLFLLRQHWKTILVSIRLLLVIALISLPLLTLDAWVQFSRVPLRMLDNPSPPVTAYQSLPSLIRHLFTYDAYWNPQPILNFPTVANILLLIFLLVIIFTTIYAIFISKEPDLPFAAVVALSIFLSPISQDYTYTVLLLPIVILIAYLREKPSLLMILITTIGILLLAANLPFKSPRLTPGFWALLAYPKLYAGLVIWSLLIWLAISRKVRE